MWWPRRSRGVLRGFVGASGSEGQPEPANGQNAREHRRVVLHVVESFGGGVATAVNDYARNTSEYDHYLYYSPRDDSPISPSNLAPFVRQIKMPRNLISRIMVLRSIVRKRKDPLIVHAHSSFGGLYARVAMRRSETHTILYTPHCYSFERMDSGRIARMLFRTVERILMLNTSGVAACSQREAQLARELNSKTPVVIVPNIVPPTRSSPGASVSRPGPPPVIVGIGRISRQKDPVFFAEAIRAIAESDPGVHAKWIGSTSDGRSSPIVHTLKNANVEVIPWMERDHVLDCLSNASLYLHTSMWDGFPITILEAVALEVPVLVRRVPSTKYIPGLLFIDKPDEIQQEWLRMQIPDYRNQIVMRQSRLLADHRPASQARALRAIYGIQSTEASRSAN